METWLRCTLSLGQFPGEYGVDGKQYDGTPFSLFLPREYTKSDQAPTGGYTAPGWVKATVVKHRGIWFSFCCRGRRSRTDLTSR